MSETQDDLQSAPPSDGRTICGEPCGPDTIATVHVAITTPTVAIVMTLEVCYCAGDSEIGTISRPKLGTPNLEIQNELDHFDSYGSLLIPFCPKQ